MAFPAPTSRAHTARPEGGEVEMWFAWKKPRDERGALVRIQ